MKYLIRFKLYHCGKKVQIEEGVRFKFTEKISIGNNVQLRAYCQLYAQNNTMGKDKIKEDVIIRIEDNVHIKENANLNSYGGFIHIGKNSNIGHNCALYGQGGIEIGENVLVGPNCSIISGNHKFADRLIPINKQGTHDVGIHICDDVWIGANVAILDGVEIGKGAVIGAGSVVTKNVEEYSVTFGSPAKFYRYRDQK